MLVLKKRLTWSGQSVFADVHFTNVILCHVMSCHFTNVIVVRSPDLGLETKVLVNCLLCCVFY